MRAPSPACWSVRYIPVPPGANEKGGAAAKRKAPPKRGLRGGKQQKDHQEDHSEPSCFEAGNRGAGLCRTSTFQSVDDVPAGSVPRRASNIGGRGYTLISGGGNPVTVEIRPGGTLWRDARLFARHDCRGPNGRFLRTTGTVHDGRVGNYLSQSGECRVCELKGRCTRAHSRSASVRVRDGLAGWASGSPASPIACSASAASPRPSSGDNGSELSSETNGRDNPLLITAIVAAKSLMSLLCPRTSI